MRVHGTRGDSRPGAAVAVVALLAGWALACGKSASTAASTDAGSDGPAGDAGLAACPVISGDADGGDAGGGDGGDGGSAASVADDFGPNAKSGATSSALGQLDVYEVTSARRLEWVDLYLRAELAGTRVTISVYEAAARGAVFRRRVMIQLDVPPCQGWVGSGPIGLALEPGRFYAIGYDPNQAVTAFVDSESSNLPIDGQFGRLIGSKTSTSVSLDTLDWGMPSDKSFTRQRIFTSPRDAADGATDAGTDVGGDAVVDVRADAGVDLGG